MRSSTRTRGRRSRFIAAGLAASLAATALAFVPASPAGAATAATNNACKYSLDPGTVRNIPLTLNGTVAPATVTSGGTVTAADLHVTGAVPGSLIVYGYYLGQLTPGVNTFPIDVSLTLEGTNTTEGTKVVTGTAQASTTITVNGLVASATDIQVNVPLTSTSFTANGSGAVNVRQAGQSATATPTANITPTATITVKRPDNSTFVGISCMPGEQNASTGPNGEAAYTTAVPDTSVDPIGSATIGGGPVDPDPDPVGTTHDCVSGLGRFVQQEVAPFQVDLIKTGTTTGTANLGGSVSLSNAKVNLKVAPSNLTSLYGRNQLSVGENTKKLWIWVAVEGTNTTEGVQTLAVEGSYTTTITDPTPGARTSGDETATALDLTLNLPNSTWTPTGGGAIEFSEGPAGSLSTIAVVGTGYQDTGYFVQPYGSIFVRTETNTYGSNLDCVNGDVSVNSGTGVPGASNFGNLPPKGAADPVLNPPYGYGSQGRYTIVPGAESAPVYTVSLMASGAGSRFQIITTNLVGSPLSLSTVGQLVTLPTVKLDGTAKTTSADLKVTNVVDPRGTNSGWNLVGKVSDFEGNNGSISGDALGWAPTATPVVDNTNAATPGSPVVSGLKSTPSTLCSAAVGASNGAFACGGQITLAVPGNASIGTYTSVLTLTLV